MFGRNALDVHIHVQVVLTPFQRWSWYCPRYFYVSGLATVQLRENMTDRPPPPPLTDGSHLGFFFFFFTIKWSWFTFSRNHFLYFDLWSFPRQEAHGLILPCAAGQRQQARAPSPPQDQEDEQPLPVPHFGTHAAILLFSFSMVFNKLHEIISPLL